MTQSNDTPRPEKERTMTGLDLIATERRRQIEAEGFDAAHDADHAEELAAAAAVYAIPPSHRGTLEVAHWPWAVEWYKPEADRSPQARVRTLAKAGALIAAAIDATTSGDGGH
jgi:hypothetical protein